MAAAAVGDIDFGIIVPDLADVASALQQFFINGSLARTVAAADLTIVTRAANPPDRFVSIAEGLQAGTKLLDLIYYFSLPQNERPAVAHEDNEDILSSENPQEISRCFFFQAFMVLVRGSPSTATDSTAGATVPAFLQNVLGLDGTPAHYADAICSFDIANVDWRFLRHIAMPQAGLEALNRLGLGVCGYRAMGPFKLYGCRRDASREAIQAYEAIRALAQAPADWGIHPLTRSAAFTAYFGSLNKSAASLMTECFTQEQLQEMVDLRIIFQLPRADPRYTQWRTWSVAANPPLSDPIFN